MTNTKISFSSSYEIKKFEEICSELLILDKAFGTNLDASDKNFKSYENTEFNLNSINSAKIDKDQENANSSKNENKNLEEARKSKESQGSVTAIWNIFVELIKKQKIEAESALSQSDMKIFDEVLYVSVCLIDEYFIRKEKNVYDFWKKNLLEFYFFKTRSAGESFYEKIDAIIQQNNTAKKNLAFIYLQALSLGFKGKYFHHGNQNDILYYKRSLYSFLYNKNLFIIDSNISTSLKNDDYVFEDLKRKDLTSTRKIYKAIYVVILLYCAFTYFLWSQKKNDLEHLLKRVSSPMESIIK